MTPKKTIEYDEQIIDDVNDNLDTALTTTIHFEPNALLHEIGTLEDWCWCEPEFLGVSEGDDCPKYRHRTFH